VFDTMAFLLMLGLLALTVGMLCVSWDKRPRRKGTNHRRK
jgi:hypothetical protein